MRALVVGAGAVGQVFARHLMKGGAEVAFLVKPVHAPAARDGFAVHQHACRGVRSETVRARVVTSAAEAGAEAWDAVLLCVPSTALAATAWLGELALATGDATIVCFGPGLGDAARVASTVGAHRAVAGGIALMAWASPLVGEDAPPGTAYWLPPLAACPFTSLGGETARVQAIARAFRAGGLRARVNKDAVGVSMTGAAVLETTAPAMARALGPRTIGAILGGLARLAPMDVDRFFEAHYSKLAAQSKAGLATWAARATEHGMPHGAIDALRERVAEVTRAA
jgi:2-dehydropantoate 2-reductase